MTSSLRIRGAALESRLGFNVIQPAKRLDRNPALFLSAQPSDFLTPSVGIFCIDVYIHSISRVVGIQRVSIQQVTSMAD